MDRNFTEMDFTGERMIPEKCQDNPIYLEHIARYQFASQFTQDRDVLDIASGSGYGADFLKTIGQAKHVLGVDIDDTAIEYSRHRYGNTNSLEYRQGDCREIPAKRNQFGTIVSFETIEHITEHDEFLKETKRVLDS